MIDPAFVTRNAVRLVIAGVIILAIVWGWDEIRSYIKYKRQKEAPPNRTIYVAMNREPLPGQFPGDGTISIFSITPVGDENGIHSDIGWSVARVRCGAPPFE